MCVWGGGGDHFDLWEVKQRKKEMLKSKTKQRQMSFQWKMTKGSVKQIKRNATKYMNKEMRFRS